MKFKILISLFFFSLYSSDVHEAATSDDKKAIQLYNPIVVMHEAITQAIQDAPYSEPDFWNKHENLYRQIIMNSAAMAAIEFSSEEEESSCEEETIEDYVNLDEMYRIIKKEITDKKAKLIKQEKPLVLNGGKSIMRLRSCNHYYHLCCIKQHLKASSSCPLCKSFISQNKKKNLIYIHPKNVGSKEICIICQEQLKRKKSRSRYCKS